MNPEQIEIVEYLAANQQDFERLNRQWIEKYFKLEPIDTFVLENPDEAIIKPGGVILLARMKGRIVGTVALKKSAEKIFELTKMAVAADIRNRGIGEKLGRAAINKAKKLGATRIVLYSNTILEKAIRLYHRIGFQNAVLEAGGYARCNLKWNTRFLILTCNRPGLLRPA